MGAIIYFREDLCFQAQQATKNIDISVEPKAV